MQVDIEELSRSLSRIVCANTEKVLRNVVLTIRQLQLQQLSGPFTIYRLPANLKFHRYYMAQKK